MSAPRLTALPPQVPWHPDDLLETLDTPLRRRALVGVTHARDAADLVAALAFCARLGGANIVSRCAMSQLIPGVTRSLSQRGIFAPDRLGATRAESVDLVDVVVKRVAVRRAVRVDPGPITARWTAAIWLIPCDLDDAVGKDGAAGAGRDVRGNGSEGGRDGSCKPASLARPRAEYVYRPTLAIAETADGDDADEVFSGETLSMVHPHHGTWPRLLAPHEHVLHLRDRLPGLGARAIVRGDRSVVRLLRAGGYPPP